MRNSIWEKELARIATILKKAPLKSEVKWGTEVFTYNNRNVISYGGFHKFFSIWFYNGVFLADKYNVLVNAQEGKTKSLRQWRFTSIIEIDEEKILEYVLEAIEIEEKGLKVLPDKNNPPATPTLLSDIFEKNGTLKEAFLKLTAGRQKEYILYLNEVKQDKTKINRVEKITPLILQGIGLNDKYK